MTRRRESAALEMSDARLTLIALQRTAARRDRCTSGKHR